MDISEDATERKWAVHVIAITNLS